MRLFKKYGSWKLAAALVLGVALMSALVIGNALLTKALDLRYRFQLAERRIESLGEVVGTTLAVHQHQRGDAPFAKPEGTSSFQSPNSWRQIGGNGIGGSWGGACFQKAKAIEIHEGYLFVGLFGPASGCVGVWRYDGQTWARSIGPESNVNWAKLDYVQVLHSAHGRLYAGINGEVWILENGQWRRALRTNEKFPWPHGTAAYSMNHDGNALLVGLTGGRSRVFRYAEGQWSEMSAGLNQGKEAGIYELHRHSDGMIYAGTMSSLGPASVYRWKGSAWEKIGGGGLRGSWISPGSTYALSFTSFQGRLIVTLNRNPQVPGKFVSVWAFDGEAWNPVGSQHVPHLWSQTDNFNASAVYRERLYVGSGGRPAGNASVWELAPGRAWRLVGGHGQFGSWSEGNKRLSGSRDATAEYPYRMLVWRGQLIVGFGDAPDAAQIWSYAATTPAK